LPQASEHHARRGRSATNSSTQPGAPQARSGGASGPPISSIVAAAVQKARDYSMPKDSIQRAIDRGTGAGDGGDTIERVVYEGYGPSGVAVLAEALTDNRNRTSAELRHAFDKNGGSLGEPGSVAWVFEKRGVVMVDAGRYTEDDLITAIDAGAEDVAREGDSLKVVSAAENLAAVREALESAGIDIESAELTMEPKNVVEVGEGDARAVMRLMEALDDHDDVEAVHANFDIPAEVLEEIAA
jgi:YebC/PmpR family DNA-binding regulatory protein